MRCAHSCAASALGLKIAKRGPASPSRLLAAFPPGTPVVRVGLDEAVKLVAEQLLTEHGFTNPAPPRHGAVVNNEGGDATTSDQR
jgi:hypothetical protein